VGCNHHAYENVIEHARKGHARHQGIPQNGPLNEYQLQVVTMIIRASGIKRSSQGLFQSPTASRTLALLLYGLLLFAAGIVLSLDGHYTVAASPPAVIVKMLDTPPVFRPIKVTIRAGETVEWQNIGNEIHHATSDPSAAISAKDISDPPGAKPFDSGFIRPGETFTYKFTTPGLYRYACVVHETKGMVGEVLVK
jgi:plastocyanin